MDYIYMDYIRITTKYIYIYIYILAMDWGILSCVLGLVGLGVWGRAEERRGRAV